MERKATITCPYCGKETRMKIPGEYGGMAICLCDPIDGGCDKYYAVDVRVNVTAHSLKVEGQEA